MLKVLISPAKKMRPEAESPLPLTLPTHLERSEQLLRALAALDADALQRLWAVSDKLFASCAELLAAQLALPSLAVGREPAVLAYVGIQYQSMAPEVMDERSLSWLSEHLRILSGFYGVLRPFDAVVPYRLEMQAKFALPSTRNLYEFWGDALAQDVAEDASCVVNLASVEYAKAVLPRLPRDLPVVTCLFGEDVRAGKPLQRSSASKCARGSMVRWMAEHEVNEPDELRAFNLGYTFEPELSRLDGSRQELVFLRHGVGMS